MTRPRIWIGTSGFHYAHWVGVFYPRNLPAAQWLEFYSRHFDTVEINNSFYRLPERSTFEGWKKETPPGFLFSVKVSRYLTHIRKLKDPEDPLLRFREHAGGLGRKLGPFLFQLPPRWKPNLERLEALLKLRRPKERWVVEFREPDWISEEVLALLRAHGVGFCVHDLLEMPPLEPTAALAYVRFHGASAPGGCYTRRALGKWAERIREWSLGGAEVFAYFNNDAHGYAVKNALELKECLLALGEGPEARGS